MKKQPLAQEILTEILIEKTALLHENLHDTQQIFLQKHKLLERIEKLYQQPITVDTANMEQAHQNIKATLEEGLCLPRWLAYTALAFCFVLALSFVTNLQLFYANRQQKAYIQGANAHIVALSDELKDKNKKKAGK